MKQIAMEIWATLPPNDQLRIVNEARQGNKLHTATEVTTGDDCAGKGIQKRYWSLTRR